MKDTRRDFLKKGMAAGMGALFIPELAKAAVANQTAVKAAPLKLKKDANNRCNTLEQLGYGYSLFTATSILEKHAASQPKIYNKGISGNKVFQLRERWEMDCLALQPDVLSILIGVNDYWHTLGGGYKGTVEIYENDLRDLLKYTKEKEFDAIFVPFQSGFDAAMKVAPARYWAGDGVHPDLPGRQLMANMWLEATGLK